MNKPILTIVFLIGYMTFFGQVNNTSIAKENDIFNPLTGTIEKMINSHEHPEDQNNPRLKSFSVDCNTDFWTTNLDGDIQQWSLINSSVVGGDTILTDAGNSLAYCGATIPTFYYTYYPSSGIYYYDSTGNWVHIPTWVKVLNNGGHKGDQYFMGEFDDVLNSVLYYFDGTNLNNVVTLNSEYFVVADIAVDTLGRAWLFKGQDELHMTSLDVYDSTGLLSSYAISYNSNHNYGSFFLNGTLYVGMGLHNPLHPNSIVPIIISGNEASLGTPIPFPDLSYSDMASCQDAQLPVSIDEEFDDKQFSDLRVSPNPFSTSTTLSYNLPQPSIVQITIFNHFGQQVDFIQQIQSQGKQQISWNASGHPSGVYYFRIQAGEQLITGKFLLVK